MKDFLTRTGDLLLPRPVLDVLEIYHIGGPKSLVYVTNWSIVHFVSGLLTGYLLLQYYPRYNYYWAGFVIHTIWEIWQLVVNNTPYTIRGMIDIGMDTVLFMAGMIVFKNFIGLLTGKKNE